MKGIQHIEVSNRKAKFKFDLFRNITIVRGDSGTGKTTLYNMIADFTRLGAASGVTISCAKPCVALVDMDWRNQLLHTSDSIVFIDEGSDFITKKEFAEAVKHSDNYYVIFNREGLHDLPYSVDEIYQIKTSGKYHRFEKMFQASEGHLYSAKRTNKKFQCQIILTEDSNSGFQFYRHYFEGSDVQCVSSGSNSAIFRWLNEHKDENILVIADGAAFGSEIDRVIKLQEAMPNTIRICLPESFEWLILKSGVINNQEISKVLEEPSTYIDSVDYFSWENYFTDFLTNITVNTPFHYQKKKINAVYLSNENCKKVANEIIAALPENTHKP